MPTRFYLPEGVTHNLTPSFSSDWERTTSATRQWMSPIKQNTPLTTTPGNYLETVTSQPYDVLVRQYISDPLAAQTISGYVKGQIRVNESNAAAEYCRALVIKVVSNDGGTVRGILLSHFPSSLESEFATSLTNRYFPPNIALTEVAAQEGDRIVIEMGFRSFNTVSDVYFGYFRFGDAAASDLPEDESTTSDYNPWIEFSANLTFLNQVRVSQVLSQVEYQVPSKLKVTQVIAQVEYVPTPPGQFTTEAPVTVVVDSSGTTAAPEVTKDAAATLTADPSGTTTIFQTAGEFVTDLEVTLSLTPEPLAIWDRVTTAAVTMEILPEAETSCPVRFGNAAVTMEILPEAATRMPVVGWDPLTGYGLTEFAWLSETPPFYVFFGNVLLSIDASAQDVSLRAEKTYDISGQLRAGGRTAVVFTKPGEIEVVAAGGATVSGKSVIEVPETPSQEYVSAAEIWLQGSLTVQHSTPAPKVWEIETRGGVRLKGSTNPVFISPQDLITEYLTVVSAKIGRVRVPEVEFVEPELDVDVLAVTTEVSLGVGGFPLVDYPELPVVFEHEVKFGKIKVGGACGVLWDYAEIIEHAAVGGVILEGRGEEGEEAFYTIALHGYTFEISLYSNFLFNSYTFHQGRALAAREDGIYVLEGTDDDGQAFHPGVRVGPTSFGLDNYKRLRFLKLEDCGDAEVRVIGKTRGAEGYYRKTRDRYEIGREVEDKEIIIEVSDFTQLSQAQIDLVILADR